MMKLHAYINGQRNRAAEKLTPAMWLMLHDTHDHGAPCYSLSGRSAYGGAERTRLSLRRASPMAHSRWPRDG
jgi:hypothetical protein